MNILSRNAVTTVIVFCSQLIVIKLATSFTPPHILSNARKFSTSDKVGKLASFQLTSNHNNLDQSVISNVREECNYVTLNNAGKACASLALFVSVFFSSPTISAATNEGASAAANAKITTGGASTLQSGRTIAITRGVNLDRSDFSSQNLRGVAFQQSIVRDANFAGSNLVGSSFFDATVDGSNFEGADMTNSNVEMAQFNRANLKNAIVREMYVSGSTLFEGVSSIEGSDWTDTYLRKDQAKYLCSHPTAKGVNPVTGVETRESLMCPN